MASGKRASMREGPLAALFRKTEEEGLSDEQPLPQEAQQQRLETEPAPPRVQPPREGGVRRQTPAAEQLRPAPPSQREPERES